MNTVQQHTATGSHNSAFPQVFEILEIFLLFLGHRDIVRASGVCTYWRSCIEESARLLRRIHKLPIPLRPYENPHFEPLMEASREALIWRGVFKHLNLWDTVREIEDNKLDSLHEISPVTQENETANAVEGAELLQAPDYWREPYSYRMDDIRDGLMGLRFDGNTPLGWPEGLHELHCDKCELWHTEFRYEHLHPLLQFFDDVTMCFRGSGSQVVIEFMLMLDIHAPKSCWVHSSDEVQFFARKMRKAYDAIQVESVAKDQCASPVITKMVSPYMAWVIEDDEGLKLRKVVPFIVRCFREHLSCGRNYCHDIVHHAPVTRRGSRSERDYWHTYPNSSDWDRHLKNYSEITKLCEETITKVDALMVGVDGWVPVMEEQPSFHHYDALTV